jgi:DNA-binding IclR family transcriptional regulator
MALVNAVYRAAQILKLLAKRKGMTLTEISTYLDIPKSSAFDIVSTLKKEGFIKIDNQELKRYSLGIASFEVGSAYLSQINLTSLVRPYLKDLMKEFETTAFLAVEDQGKIVYLDKIEPSTTARTTLSLGTRQDMYHTALGKALLACHSEEEVKQIIGEESLMKLKTERTITNYLELLKELEITRKRGYAIDNREGNNNVYCLAALLLNDKSDPVAAISLSFLYYEIRDKDMEIVARRIKDTALKISEKLGYQASVVFL